MKPIRVLLADDHALVRAGFRALLENMADVVVVGEAADGRQALTLVAAQKPDIVFMDIGMPELNGLDATAQIVSKYPDVAVVILSMHMTEEYVLRALQAGTTGYLLKDADSTELETALRVVARGQTYLCTAVSEQMIADYLQRTTGKSTTDWIKPPLTPRQREVLQLVAEGHTSMQIADTLQISLKTVEAHRQNIMERLDIHDLASLVRYALRTGLIIQD